MIPVYGVILYLLPSARLWLFRFLQNIGKLERWEKEKERKLEGTRHRNRTLARLLPLRHTTTCSWLVPDIPCLPREDANWAQAIPRLEAGPQASSK